MSIWLYAAAIAATLLFVGFLAATDEETPLPPLWRRLAQYLVVALLADLVILGAFVVLLVLQEVR